jgi:hypothetical protein
MVAQALHELPTLAILCFLRELLQLYNIAFFGDHAQCKLGRSWKIWRELPQWKTNSDFFLAFCRITCVTAQMHVRDPDPCQVESRSF